MRQNRPAKSAQGFTLIEIVVSTTIFAVVLTMMLTLFNYTLKINRRAEALRQATQGARNFTEFLIKEIRNGRIDYGPPPTGLPPAGTCPTSYNNSFQGDTKLGLININEEQECVYLSGTNLMLVKKIGTEEFPEQRLNPPGVSIIGLKFYVRPPTNPYDTTNPPQMQPLVTMLIKFQVQMSNSEAPVIIPYQTSISTDFYDIPH